jgi:hypothetical protein
MITDSIYYYDEDGDIYNNQIDALLSGKNCYLYFYDKEMRMVDWKTEPHESLDTLYKIRAQYIRDKYKYVILCYSGGHDSTNILETFYYNNIHIDEILVVGALARDSYKGSDENHNGELYENVFPTLSRLNLPNTKITVADYTKWFNDPKINFTALSNHGREWTKHIGGFRSVHTLFWHDLKKFIGHQNSKDTCYIMGTDKVNLDYRIGHKSNVFFVDLSFFDYGSKYHDENFQRVNFYTDVHFTATNIIRKQAHVVNTYKRINNYGDADETENEILNKLLYDLKHPLVFMSPKSISTSVSARDMFMFEHKNSEIYNIFIDGLKYINRLGFSTKQQYKFRSKPHFIE